MAKVAPYHTNTWEPAYGERNVHHDRDDCKYGRAIKPEHWRSGTGSHPLCMECQRLAR
jgi:hypothetical protein